jgi:hypothetical protein
MLTNFSHLPNWVWLKFFSLLILVIWLKLDPNTLYVKKWYSLRIEILGAIDFFLQFRPFVLFKKLCKYNLFCLLYALLLYVFLSLTYRFTVCDNFLNKTNGQSCKKKSTVTNISLRKEYVGGQIGKHTGSGEDERSTTEDHKGRLVVVMKKQVTMKDILWVITCKK